MEQEPTAKSDGPARSWWPLGRIKPKDRAPRLRWRLWLIAGAVAMVGVARLCAAFPAFTETVYANGVWPLIGRALAWVSGLVRFSVAEVILGVLLASIVLLFLRAAYQVLRGRRRALNAVACGGLFLVTTMAVLLVLFYALWGLNYSRPPLVARMQWQDLAKELPRDEGTQELARLCEELVAATNDAYQQALGTEDLGEPSAPPTSIAAVDDSIERAYMRVAERLDLPASFAARRAAAKAVAGSVVMSHLLISGVYSPWTGEANYNRLPPACGIPHTIAHEKSHQRGITSEDEANFYGFLACAHSDQPYIRYSGYFFAQRQLLGELYKADRDRAKALLKARLPGVQRDVDAIRAYVMRHVGPVSKASHKVNNAYLKANRVKGGTLSYRMSARLLVTFARMNGGSCVVPAQQAPPGVRAASTYAPSRS